MQRSWVSLGLCLLLWGCQDEEPPKPPRKLTQGAVTLSGASLDYVRVEPVAKPSATVQRPLLSRVSFDEQRVAVLGAPVSGRVAAVHVVTGSVVKPGDALLTIHSGDVAAVRSQLAQAKEARALAEQRAARASLLVTQGAGSEAESQEANTALASARTEEQRANAALGALGGATSSATDYVLKSPIAGTVVERNVEVGNAVGADQGQPLITVADLANVWIVADLYEQDLPYVRTGQPAHVTIPALGGRKYEGKVSYVGNVVDANTRTTRARVELKNGDGALRPGMFADMVVEAPESASGVVPTSALLARRDETFVFVETKPGHFEQRKVRAGAQTGDYVVLLSGVQPGERVVTRGAILLDAEANAAF
ncbi:MAG: efflux RND transporter periplasmic adaptor subunit [Myxococcales bacterium]